MVSIQVDEVSFERDSVEDERPETIVQITYIVSIGEPQGDNGRHPLRVPFFMTPFLFKSPLQSVVRSTRVVDGSDSACDSTVTTWSVRGVHSNASIMPIAADRRSVMLLVCC